MATPAQQLTTWLRDPDEGLTRLEVRYVRRRSFRWLVLIELLVGLVVLVFCCTLLIVGLALMMMVGDGDLDLDFDLPGLSPRFYAYWQEIVVQGLDKDGEVRFEVTHQPRTMAERDALVAQVLAAASRASLVVHESMGEDVPEQLETWYGGQPLLAHPEQRDLQVSLSVLKQWDWELDRPEEPGLRLQRRASLPSRFWGVIELTISVFLLPLALFGSRGWLRSIRSAWADVRGVPAATWRVEVDEEAVRLRWQREDWVQDQVVLHATDMLGVAFSPTLGFDRDVERKPPTLTLVARDELVRTRIPLQAREGRAMCDAIVGAAIASWEGIPTTMLRPSKCPFCATLYTFEAETPCPSCGAWPTER